MKGCAIVVLGHVDHGKTTLVKALTGIDTDRLAEEKQRGLSIVPGFAYRAYDSGTVDFIDAPGHADFIRATVGAASGAAAALLVVSALEGIAAQTLEHLEILRALGIRRGVVALSKCEGQKNVAEAVAVLRDGLRGTALEGARIVPCSAHDGVGLDNLNAAISALIRETEPAMAPLCAFLPVDRVFAVAGRGAVVTGTLAGGTLRVGETLYLQPGNRKVILREVQSRRQPVPQADPGTRVAVNLRGIEAEAVRPGDVLCAGEGIGVTTRMDIEIDMFADVRPLKHMQQLRVLLGSGAAVARLRLMRDQGRGVLPGQSAVATLQFDAPQVAYAGQRAVLRHLSPAQTCGGAVVLDPQAPEGRARDRLPLVEATQRADPLAIAHKLGGRGALSLRRAAQLARCDVKTLWNRIQEEFVRIEGDRALSRGSVEDARGSVIRALADYHAAHPLRPVAPPTLVALDEVLLAHVLDRLQREGEVCRDATGIALAAHDPIAAMTQDDRVALIALEDKLRAGGARPPDLGDLDPRGRDLLAILLRAGRAVRLHNVALDQWVVFHADTLAQAEAVLRASVDGPFRTGEARALLETSRKFIVPLLEHFDAVGLTQRDGTVRWLRN